MGGFFMSIELKDQQIKAFDQRNHRVIEVTPSGFRKAVAEGNPLLAAVPYQQKKGLDGEIIAIYHPNNEVNKLVAASLQRIVRSNGHFGFEEDGINHLATAVLYSPDPVGMTIELLDYAADEVGKKNPSQEKALTGLKDVLASKSKPKPQIEIETASEYAPLDFAEKLISTMDNRELTTGETFGRQRDILARQRAERRVERDITRIEKPFSQLIEDIETSLRENLQTKEKLTEVITEPNDLRDLRVEIIAIKANIGYCAVFRENDATYDTFENIADELTARIQDRIAAQENNQSTFDSLDISEPETELQTISSLRGQFREAKRLRNNALLDINGSPEKPGSGLVNDAITIRKKRLSETYNEHGIPLISQLATDKLAPNINRAMEQKNQIISTQSDFLNIYKEALWEDVVLGDVPLDIRKQDHYLQRLIDGDVAILQELLDELEELAPDNAFRNNDFVGFIAKNYVTSTNNTRLDEVKAQIMKLVVPIIEEKYEIDLRSKFDENILSIGANVDQRDLVEAAKRLEDIAILQEIGQNMFVILGSLDIPPNERESFIENNREKLSSVLLAYHEIATLANDKHLNSKAVLENLTDATFNDKPISLQVIRCLRWCYPFRTLDIIPHAGDYYSFNAEGKPIVRKESVEKEKLKRFHDWVATPIQHHGIDVKELVLVCAGDAELTGPGYNLSPDDPRAINARTYIEDLKQRAPKWDVTGETPIRVISINEIIDSFGREEFNNILGEVQSNYDAVFHDKDLNYLGYTGKNLERYIDREHLHRQPFNSEWSRQKSRDYTRHVTTLFIAFGAVLGSQESPRLLTMTGNEYAGRPLSFGHTIYDRASPLGITFFRSINDGDQSEILKKVSSIVD